MSVNICKCCGHPVASEAITAKLSKSERKFFNIVQKAGNYGLPMEAAAEIFYADDPDGGALSNTIQVFRSRANKKLRPYGLYITAAGCDGIYRLEKMA